MLLSRTNFGKYCLLDNSPGPDHTQACKIPWNLNYGPGHCPAVRKMCERCWWGEFSSNQPQPSLLKDSCRTLLRDTLEFPPDRGGNWLDVSGFFHWLRNTAKARIQTQDCVQHSKADSFPRRFSGGHHLSPCPFSYLPHLNQSWAGTLDASPTFSWIRSHSKMLICLIPQSVWSWHFDSASTQDSCHLEQAVQPR